MLYLKVQMVSEEVLWVTWDVLIEEVLLIEGGCYGDGCPGVLVVSRQRLGMF